MVTNTIEFPGRPISAGEKDTNIVSELQRRLNAMGLGPLTPDGVFGPRTRQAVQTFQVNRTLRPTGIVDAGTWSALFATPAAVFLPAQALREAAARLGVTENPLGSNRGPEVDAYLRSAGLNPEGASYPWCTAFVYYCFDVAAKTQGRANPVVRTAGALDLWRKSCDRGVPHLLPADADGIASKIQPGMIFVMSMGGGAGHVGFVESAAGDHLVTIEGNTSGAGSREGIGVFRQTSRRVSHINVGFLDYSTL
jgi:hypothetical protein